jgi:DNA polymerase I-like protein with 3'-5' exonuclease and polymerase domains
MRRNGNMFVSPFGRPRRLPDISSPERWRVERAKRQMMSSMVSGTAADMLKEIMLRCHQVLQAMAPHGIMRGTIHDELIFDLPIAVAGKTIPELMRAFTTWPLFEQQSMPIRASCEVSVTDWSEKRGITVHENGFSWN